MQVHASRSPSRPEPGTQPWAGLEPEMLEDAARSLCALRPGSRAAERLMERAAYLRATRLLPPCDRNGTSALLLG